MRYLLGLGSNIAPLQHLASARQALTQQGELLATSPTVETTPVGEGFSDGFYNQLLVIETDLVAPLLKQRLQRIEEQLGREPKTPARKHRDRPIDIDILAPLSDVNDAYHIELEDSYYATVQQQWRNELDRTPLTVTETSDHND
ncbi:MAG: 2-amino-4-hydroxy-6-hydroxymethyldihydropteridine diphosphokinase [Bacterioplanes sp.]|nr:2-amino-4-hydroxy-6-hydroxymethyldihydropteridine diphosphokinase [Bacterioplanes sp.]